MPKRKRRGKREDEYIHYVVSISGWDHSYGFGLSHSRFEIGPYSKHASIVFTGDLIRPEGFRYPRSIVTLASRTGMLSEQGEGSGKSIGMLNGREDLLDVYVFVPAEDMAELVSLALSGRIQAAVITGTPLKWRRGTVHSVYLETDFNEENY